MDGFAKRHQEELGYRLGRCIKKARAALTEQDITEYIDKLETALMAVPWDNIMNYDEVVTIYFISVKILLAAQSAKYFINF